MSDNILLIEKVKKGDKIAEEELVKNNMNLVRSIAGRFLGRGCETEDLLQIGAIGLLKAIHKFDLSYKVKFSTYAVPVIAGEIKRFLRDDGIIKISRSLKEIAQKGKRCAEELRVSLGREPTLQEVSELSNIAMETLVEAFDACMPVESVNIPDENGKESEKFSLNNKDEENEIVNRIFVEDMLNSLPKREKQILLLRYFKGKTQAETAKIVGVSQVQISRLEKIAVKKLKESFL